MTKQQGKVTKKIFSVTTGTAASERSWRELLEERAKQGPGAETGLPQSTVDDTWEADRSDAEPPPPSSEDG